MLEEWRLICSARVAELQLIKSCDRNKELYFMLEETKTETEALCDDIATILGALRVYDTDLGKIDQFWVSLRRICLLYISFSHKRGDEAVGRCCQDQTVHRRIANRGIDELNK